MSGSYVLSSAINSSAPNIMGLAGQIYATDKQTALGNRELDLREQAMMSDDIYRNRIVNEESRRFDKQHEFDVTKFEALNKRAAELHAVNKERIQAETGTLNAKTGLIDAQTGLTKAQTGQVDAATQGQKIRNNAELAKQVGAEFRPVIESLQQRLNKAIAGKDENGNYVYNEAMLAGDPAVLELAQATLTLGYGGILGNRPHATDGMNTQVLLQPVGNTGQFMIGMKTANGAKPLTRGQGKYPEDNDVVTGKPSDIIRTAIAGATRYVGISSAEDNLTLMEGMDEFISTSDQMTGGALIPKPVNANSEGLKANALSVMNSPNVTDKQLNMAMGNPVTDYQQRVSSRRDGMTEGEVAQDQLMAETAKGTTEELHDYKNVQRQERAISLIWEDVYEGDKGVLENLGDFFMGEDAAWDSEKEMRNDVARVTSNPDNVDNIARLLEIPKAKRKWSKDDWYRVIDMIREQRENGRYSESTGLLTFPKAFLNKAIGTRPEAGKWPGVRE